MKKVIFYIGFMLLSSFVSFAQDANFNIQLTIDDNGTIKDPVGDYQLTVADLSVELANLAYSNCVQAPGVTEEWYLFESYSFFSLNLNIFQPCGGWKTNDQIQITVTVHKVGSPLDGLSGVCVFNASDGGALEGNDAIVIKTKPAATISLDKPELVLCQGATANNTVKATTSDGSTVAWALAGGGTLPAGMTASGNTLTVGATTAYGTYSVVATSGAVTSDPVAITVNQTPTVKPVIDNPGAICLGEDVYLEISNSNAQPAGVKYAWTPASGDGDIAIYTPTSKTQKYSVKPVLGTCEGPASDQLTLTFKPDIAQSGNTAFTCDVTSYEAVVTLSGGKGVDGEFKIWTDANHTVAYAGAVQQEGAAKNQLRFKGLASGGSTKVYVTSPNTCGEVVLDLSHTCPCEATLALSGGGAFCAGDTPKQVAVNITADSRYKNWDFKLKSPDGSYIYEVSDEKTQKAWSHNPTASGNYTIEGFKVYNTDRSESCSGTVTGSPVTVTVNPKPTLTLTATPAGLCAGDNLKLEATIQNAAAPYNCTWTGSGAAGQTTAVVNTKVVAGSTDYTVQVTDFNGCISDVSAPKTVVGNQVNVTGVTAAVNPVNYNDKTTLDCTVDLVPKEAGHTIAGYEWKSGVDASKIDGDNTLKTPSTVNLTAATPYTVIVTDNHGCTGSGNVTVNVTGGKLNVIAQNAEGCEGDDITVKCTATGGVDGVMKTYEWESEDNRLAFVDKTAQNPVVKTNTLAGTYKVRVTVKAGNNTAVSDWVTVKVGQKPEISGLTSDVENNICIPNTEVHISLNYASGGAILAWSSDPTGQIKETSADMMQVTTHAFPSKNRTYKFTVRATNGDGGCPVDSSIYIEVKGSSLDLSFKGDVDICQSEEKELFSLLQVSGGVGDVANYKYSWSVSNANLKLSATVGKDVKILSSSLPGDYSIEVTVEDEKGNKATKQLPVKITEKPVLSNVWASKELAFIGDNVTLYVDFTPEGVVPEWSGGPLETKTGKNVTTGAYTTDGKYTYTVNAKNGQCAAEPLKIDITVTTPDAPIEVTMNDVEGCAGSAITLTGSAIGGKNTNYTFTWESQDPGLTLPSRYGATNSVPASTAPGTYRIKVTASDGTSFSSKTITVTVKETPKVTSVYATLTGETAHITAAEIGDVVDLTAEAEPVDVSYKWSSTNGQLLSSVGPLVSTGAITSTGALLYKVEVSKNSCTAEGSVTINVSRPSVGGLLTMKVDHQCANSGNPLTITMEASGGDSYSFVLRDKYNNSVKTVESEGGPVWTYEVSPTEEGVYKLTDFVAKKNGVELSTSVRPSNLTASFYPTPNVYAYKESTMVHCEGDVLVLKASGDKDLEYEWDNDVKDGGGFVPTVSTTYTVTATDGNGCKNTSSVAVTLADKPTVAVPEDVELCNGDPVSLKATGNADTYTWNNGIENDVIFRPTKTAKYVVEAKFLTTGCITRDTVTVTVNQAPVIVSASKHERNIAIGKNANLGVKAMGENLGYKWQWKENGDWSDLSDMDGIPAISGTGTDTLRLVNIPKHWDGTELKCIVTGSCGGDDTTFIIHVRECFELAADIAMGTGILPDEIPGDQVDGWYCIGTKIELNATLFGLDEDVEIENPHYKWKTDGRDFHDEHDKNINTDTPVLAWIPERWEDDVNVQVCAYSDGACDTVCSKILRLKARQPDVVNMKIVTSIDPARMFCPGDTVDVTVAMNNEGQGSNIQWYRDIFDKGTGLQKKFVMDQKDTWIRAVLLPSAELCLEHPVMDSAFLRVKDFVEPTLRIDNNIHDTLACQGDTLLFQAIWSNAGENPLLSWQQDLWNRGNGEYAVIGLNDKDTWVKCILTPGNDVCFSGPMVADSMVVRVREAGNLIISVDMTDKHFGDELTFVSQVENMTGTWNYNWYVNNNLTDCEEKDYITDNLKQGDVVQSAIGGNEVCLNKIFSNKIVVDYAGYVNRDTMLTIYQGEKIRDLDMTKPCDEIGKVIFRIDIPSLYGAATITPDGLFTYTPNTGFVGTDYVKYVIMNRFDKSIIAEGYIYVTVKDNNRFQIPNLITPNDDGLNDTWKLDFLTEYPNHRITVYDRNGKPVFEGTSYQNDWDGSGFTKGGYVGHINLVNGVYTYVIELGDKNKTVLKSWIEIRANLNRRNYR